MGLVNTNNKGTQPMKEKPAPVVEEDFVVEKVLEKR